MFINEDPAIGINGFGRIGRCILRTCLNRGIPIKAINADRTPEALAYLLELDSVHRRYEADIHIAKDSIVINGQKIQITRYRDPSQIPWKENGVDYVVESTGRFCSYEDASMHLAGGAKKVVISAPPKGERKVPTFVMGVNHLSYTPNMDIVSNASCTTNCLAPLAKVIHNNFGIESGAILTVHAATSKENMVDGFDKKDPRIARSAYENIIPSTTGAARAIGSVIPELVGKLDGLSARIPLPNGSLLNLFVNLNTPTSFDQLCETIQYHSENNMKGIIAYSSSKFGLVSSDILGDSHTCIFDPMASMQITPRVFLLSAFYDNEWGFSNKLVDLILHMHSVE